MRTLIAFFASLVAFGQASAVFKPISLKAAETQNIGMWNVYVVAPPGSTFSRAALMMAAPELRDLPNDIAALALTRQAGRDRRRIISLMVGAGAAAMSLWTKDARWAIASPGVAIITDLLQKQAFDPEVLVRRLLPDEVAIPASGGVQYVVAASLMRGAKPIGPVPVAGSVVDPRTANIMSPTTGYRWVLEAQPK